MTIHYIKLSDFMSEVSNVRKYEQEWLLRTVTIGIYGMSI